MCPVSRLRARPVRYRIAINAAHRAGVVGADIARFRAEAAGPVAFLPGRDWLCRDIRQPIRIDASRGRYSGDRYIGLRAYRQRHAMFRRNIQKRAQKGLFFLNRWVEPGKSTNFGRLIEVSACFSVYLGHGYDDFIDIPVHL